MNRLAIIGDYNEAFRPHPATNEAIRYALPLLNSQLTWDWLPTLDIEPGFNKITAHYDGYWIAPGSPYQSMSGALKIIQFARENKMPVLGTCGGFQHMVIEFARHVLGITDAEHAEYDPYASKLVVTPLTCSMAGQSLEITLPDKESKTYRIFGADTIREKYYCNFGLNPEYQQAIHDLGFKVTGTDDSKEVRILELDQHPFFIATLFVPQDNSTANQPHPLITAFLQSIIDQ